MQVKRFISLKTLPSFINGKETSVIKFHKKYVTMQFLHLHLSNKNYWINMRYYFFGLFTYYILTTFGNDSFETSNSLRRYS